MVDGSQYLSFHHDPFSLSLLLDVLFLHWFEGVELPSGFFPDEDHFSIWAFADNWEKGVIVERGTLHVISTILYFILSNLQKTIISKSVEMSKGHKKVRFYRANTVSANYSWPCFTGVVQFGVTSRRIVTGLSIFDAMMGKWSFFRIEVYCSRYGD